MNETCHNFSSLQHILHSVPQEKKKKKNHETLICACSRGSSSLAIVIFLSFSNLKISCCDIFLTCAATSPIDDFPCRFLSSLKEWTRKIHLCISFGKANAHWAQVLKAKRRKKNLTNLKLGSAFRVAYFRISLHGTKDLTFSSSKRYCNAKSN